MKILHLMAAKGQGGAEKFFERLVIALHEQGVEQHIIVKNPHYLETLSPYVASKKRLLFGHYPNIWSDYQIYKTQKRIKADIILSWMSRASFHVGRFNIGTDAVKIARLGGYYPIKYYKNIEHFVANTPDIKQYLHTQHVAKDRVAYISNFIDEVAGKPLKKSALGLAENSKMILSLGRLHPHKAFDCAIRMLCHLPANFELVIAGSGQELEALQQVAAKHNVHKRVHFLGWRNDIQDLLATADYYVSSACIEPLGNTILESWYQKTPVIATLSEGPSQYMQHGINGMLAPINDDKKLAHHIMQCEQDVDLRKNLTHHGYQSYQQHYSKASITAQYTRFFDTVLTQKNTVL